MKPEDITVDNLEDNLNFDSNYLGRFEEECEFQKAKIQQNELQIEDYRSEIEKLKNTIEAESILKGKEKTENEIILAKKDEEIHMQSIELEKYRSEEKRKKDKKVFHKKILTFIWKVFARIFILLVVGFVSYKVAKYVKADAANTVAIIVTVLGIFIGGVDIMKNVYKNVFGEVL